MKVNFQIVHDSEDINAILIEAIRDAYENLYIEKTDDELKFLYEVKYNLDLKYSKYVTGFEIEVDEIPSEDYEVFLENYAGKIQEDKHVYALIKFHDETRFETYLNYYREIAEIEMQLREILSYIFYYEYSEDFYNLFEEYEVKSLKDTPKEEELKTRLENQFFYLTFRNYLALDKPKEIRLIRDINTILENSDSYDDFRDKICNRGIKNEKHLEFLAAIKQDLQTIEGVRNSVAHNRTIPGTKLGHFETAKDELNQNFKEFWAETGE